MDINLPSHDSSQFSRRSSSQHQRGFEFQMSTASLQREATTSPADELFYKGKLLPLHLPPRIEMIEKLLRDSVSAYKELYGTTPTSTTVNTPFKSCNVSPCKSRSISRKLTLEKSWLRNINQIKRRLFYPKLKGSRDFFKFLIGKSGCSDDSSAAATKGFVSASSRRRDEYLNRKENPCKGDRFQQVQHKQSPAKLSPEESATDNGFSLCQDRRSFSLLSRWHQSNKICSSSFSLFSSSSSLSSTLASKERSASWERNRLPYVDTESPIQAAIAYCRQSQNLLRGREL